jgi:hypothetical protein
MFFGPGRIFLWTWGYKKCRGRACVFSGPCGNIFFWTRMFLCWTQGHFLDHQINCFWARFLFFGPCTCFVDLASIGWGGNSIVIDYYRRSHWAGCFWTLAPSFLEPVHVFFGPSTGWEEFRYWDKMHARSCWCRRIRTLKQHKRKKLWRGQRGETYIWNQMDAGSWDAHWGKRKLDIKTRWAQ